MKKQRKSTRYQMDDSTDPIYEYTAECEAGLLLSINEMSQAEIRQVLADLQFRLFR